jgi:DNA polymerase-3 subunit epsilon
VDVTPTRSALEAALLEPDEIKRLRPPYNVALQEKDRRLGYGSWTLRGVAPRPDERHPHGPLLLQAPRPPLLALLQLLDSGGGARAAERLGANVLGVPRRYTPPLDCLRAGLDIFVRRHGRWWTRGSPLAALRTIAVRLGRRRAFEPSSPRAPDDERPPSPGERWSAEGVASTLEDVVARGAHALRRARWLCALSECSLVWTPDRAAGAGRCLVLSRGTVVAGHEPSPGSGAPLPPGHAVPLRERQESIDLAAYDRLSTLSRELKALVAGAGTVTLRLGPDTVLDRKAVGEALRGR